MEKTYRKAVSLCLLLAVMFMIVGIAAGDDGTSTVSTSTPSLMEILIKWPPIPGNLVVVSLFNKVVYTVDDS
jgi:hypothetical protein